MKVWSTAVFMVFPCVIALFLSGCNQEERPANDTSGCSIALVRVDGEPLTVESVSNTVMITARIAELSNRPVNKKLFARWGNRLAMRIIPGLVQGMLLERELKGIGIRQTADSDARTLSRYNKMTGRNAKNIDELAVSFGDLNIQLRQQFERESIFQAFYDSKCADEISEDQIVRHYQDLSNTVSRLAKLDIEAHRKAESAWARLNAGEEWASVATNCTEDALLDKGNADNWKEWMDFKLENVEPEELKIAVSQLKVGAYTRPIETDEGLVIARVTAREGDALTCARILFRMAVKLEIPSREQVIKDLQQERKIQLQNEILAGVREKVKIEYPLGMKFRYEIWPLPKKTPKRQNGR